MRNLKKFLALVMAMVMAFSLMVTANAAVTANVEYPDSAQADKAFDEAITVLSGMGVFSGDNGEFYPTRNVTRAEAAALIYRLATGDVTDAQAGLYAKYGNFDDVKTDAWYAGYVGYCANAGYIKGRPGNVFDPSGSVTGYEVLAMILRVVGYDKNGEFTGADWQVNVSALSQSLGVVANVNTTQYGGTLYLAAQRQVVADLLFQTDAFVPTVNYTTAFGYQPYGTTGGVVGSVKNQTLGEKVFGLTSNVGVVVGNEATGEGKGVTKVGFSLDSKANSTIIGSVTDGTTGTTLGVNQTSFTTVIDDTMKIHAIAGTDHAYGSAYVYASDTTNALPQNVTRAFQWDSGLKQFGHAMKVWYDNRSSKTVTVGDIDGTTGTATFTTDLKTYAMFDKNTASVVVLADEGAQLANGSDANLATLGEAAKDEGFKVGEKAYMNYAFAPTKANPANAGDGIGWDTTAQASPIKENNDTGNYPLYLLISNSDDEALELVITLDLTFTKIVQENTTVRHPSVGVLNENGASGTEYFGITADEAKLYNGVQGITGFDDSYVNLLQANLVGNSVGKTVADLGKKIAAIEITGTTGTNDGAPTRVTAGNATDGNAKQPANSGLTSTYYYQLTEVTKTKPGTVVKVDYGTQEVWLSDGTKLDQSIFAESVDGSFTTNIEAADPTPSAILYAGREYTFYLDENGDYIWWEIGATKSTFVYGTYIDFYTKTASSSFDYPLVYVSANGEAKQTANITKVTDATISPDGNLGRDVYNAIQLPKRDNQAMTAGTAGYVKGDYVGYALDADGKLVAVTATDSKETGFNQASAENFGNTTGGDDSDGKIQITATDVAITAKSVGTKAAPENNVQLFMTNNTKFYIVDGAGTDNQTVKPYDGLAGLMEGNSKVIIDGVTALSGKKYLANNTDPYKMIYFNADNFTYAQTYATSAKEIKSIFIPKDCITFIPTVESNLVFVGNSTSKVVSSVGPDCTLYTMYQNGVEKDIWVEGYPTDSTSSAYHIADNGHNVFYCLVPTSDKATDGETIYKITAVKDANKKVIGQYWGDAVDNNNDADDTLVMTTNPGTTVKTTAPLYSATTANSQVAFIGNKSHASTDPLFNVASAVIKNLSRNYTVETLTDLNNAGSLATNVAVPVSCILGSSTQIVSCIYVNYNAAPTAVD